MDQEESIFDLPIERLDLIDHDVYKWICMVKGCTRGTHIRDYGESPLSGAQIIELREFMLCPWFEIIKLGVVTGPGERNYQLISEYYDREKKTRFTKVI